MRVGIIGGGNMGLAYARSLLRKNRIETEDLYIYESFPEQVMYLKSLEIANIKPELDADISKMDFIILAVKPQSFKELSESLKPLLNSKTVLISIMAGVTTELIGQLLESSKIVRAMPNTPCQNGLGATGYLMFEGIDEQETERVKAILASTGICVEVASEDLIDSVTALSGSGPAYVYAFAKAMRQAGLFMGIEEENSTQLLLQTIKGALNLMETSGKSFDELITNVKSKGGTTEAALNHLELQGFEGLMVDALTKAKDRAKELSQSIG